jgi:hypothetical protein
VSLRVYKRFKTKTTGDKNVGDVQEGVSESVARRSGKGGLLKMLANREVMRMSLEVEQGGKGECGGAL